MTIPKRAPAFFMLISSPPFSGDADRLRAGVSAQPKPGATGCFSEGVAGAQLLRKPRV